MIEKLAAIARWTAARWMPVTTLAVAAATAVGTGIIPVPISTAPGLDDGERSAYQRRYDALNVEPSRARELAVAADRMIKHRLQYEAVQEATGVDWYIISAIDEMESGGGCRAHLHNGDSLSRRTVNVPAGRPKSGEPPFTWFASAVDALEGMGWSETWDYDTADLAWKLEGFNGWGYVKKRVPSPYLWAASVGQPRGKYVADGVYDRNARSGQIGAMVLLRELERRGAIQIQRWNKEGKR